MQLLPSNQATYKASESSLEQGRGASAKAKQECEHPAESSAAQQFCVLNETGALVAVNTAWRELAEANPLTPPQAAVGANYLALCEALTGPAAEHARALAAGIRAVLSEGRGVFPGIYQPATHRTAMVCGPGDGPLWQCSRTGASNLS